MDVMDRIRGQVESNAVVLYMKGTPQFPMCGFSSRTVEVLKRSGVDFTHINVLADPEVLDNLPRFANWPTFPQLYVNGELVGGCDITLEMFETGELQPLLEAAVKNRQAQAG